MSQSEEDHLIAEALRSRTDALRKQRLVGDRLRLLGERLKRIGESISPFDGKEPDWETVEAGLNMPHMNEAVADVLDAGKIRSLIAELIQLHRTVGECTAKLRGYGAE